VFGRRVEQANSICAGRGVFDDWIRALPREKNQIFDGTVRRWESSFAMMSVALDDALSMRARGELVCAREHLSISAVLLNGLSLSLIAFCESVANRGRYIRNIPSVEPLNPDFFRGNTAQSAATWNGILHWLIFGDRLRFVHKLRILSNTFEQIECEFSKAAKEIAASAEPATGWTVLDPLHYDFNTCLRETEVVLKSFLRALPADQLAAFAGEVESPVPRHTRVGSRPRLSRASA
jgi:hypothetical protein